MLVKPILKDDDMLCQKILKDEDFSKKVVVLGFV